MTSPAEQLALESQQIYQRYFGQFGTSPVTGDPFRDVAGLLRQLRTSMAGIRRAVAASRFSDAVIPAFLRATSFDPELIDNAIAAAEASARATDASVRTNLAGADTIAAISRREAAEIAAVPDPESPAGQAAILAIIEKYQAQAAQAMTRSATAQQTAGQQAASAAGPGSAASSGGLANIGQLLSSRLGPLTGGGKGGESGNPLGSALGGLPLASLLGPALAGPEGTPPFEQLADPTQPPDTVGAGPVPATLAGATSGAPAAPGTSAGQTPVAARSVTPVAQSTSVPGEDERSERGAAGRSLPSAPGASSPARRNPATLVSASTSSGVEESGPEGDTAGLPTESAASA